MAQSYIIYYMLKTYENKLLYMDLHYTKEVLDIYTALTNRRGSSNTKLWAAIALPGSSVTKSVQEKERRRYRG